MDIRGQETMGRQILTPGPAAPPPPRVSYSEERQGRGNQSPAESINTNMDLQEDGMLLEPKVIILGTGR